jgi:hypothetical protein
MTNLFTYLLFFGLLSFLVAFLLFQYVFSIYEIDYVISKQTKNNLVEYSITAVPLNSFGKKAPFRQVSVAFSFQNDDNVRIVSNVNSSISFNISTEKEIVVYARSSYSQNPSILRIE